MLCLSLSLSAACSASASSPTTSTAVTSTTAVTTSTTVAAAPETSSTTTAALATDVLAGLRIEPEHPGTGYRRDLFEHWIDADHDGCNTRCEVLAAERRTDLPGLPDGGWRSIYDGYTTDDPHELDVDHVVALAEAWRSGADGWDAARRRDFANDLDEPGALMAVTASSNRSKGDKDPAEWQPSSRDSWCEWATGWLHTKVKWGLSGDEQEAQALRNILAGC